MSRYLLVDEEKQGVKVFMDPDKVAIHLLGRRLSDYIIIKEEDDRTNPRIVRPEPEYSCIVSSLIHA